MHVGYTGVDLEKNLGGGANEQNLAGGRGNVTKLSIIDQIDKFILKKE
jgi:hypothetical protein